MALVPQSVECGPLTISIRSTSRMGRTPKSIADPTPPRTLWPSSSMRTRLPTPRAIPLEPRMSIWPALNVTPCAKGSASSRLVTSRFASSSDPITATLVGASPGRVADRLAVTVTPGTSKRRLLMGIRNGSWPGACGTTECSTVVYPSAVTTSACGPGPGRTSEKLPSAPVNARSGVPTTRTSACTTAVPSSASMTMPRKGAFSWAVADPDATKTASQRSAPQTRPGLRTVTDAARPLWRLTARVAGPRPSEWSSRRCTSPFAAGSGRPAAQSGTPAPMFRRVDWCRCRSREVR